MRPNDMLRRDFIRWMALAGASTTLPGMALLPRAARAASTTRPPLFVSVEAVGAYDITLFCDPRGNTGSNPPNHGYAPQDIRTIGAFKVAPQFGCVVDFFSAYYAKMLVINGVDANTIYHATGERSSMSGYDGVGYPVTGALVGAIAPRLASAVHVEWRLKLHREYRRHDAVGRWNRRRPSDPHGR